MRFISGQIIALMVTYLMAASVWAGEVLVSSEGEYKDAVKRLQPGDTLVLANGEWRDFEVVFSGQGSAENPITLTAETKGKVILTGQSNLRLAGKHLVVSGLVFKDGYSPTNTVISFRRTKGEYANHSRVTEVVIDHFNNPERFETDHWVLMYGKYNRFDHNHLEGKSNKGVTMAVRLDTEESRENHHRIDHNYFGPRPVLGSNGGETLRIGTSHYSMSDSFTIVENNYFDRCNGEVEIVSSKSGSNVFRGNLFFESRGTLTLRHGNGTVVESNVFLGNGVDHTGGIRVINKRQTIRNNYMYGLTGHRFGGGFVVMNGVPNSPINRYHQVQDSTIENNSIIDIDHLELAAGSDAERSAPPISTLFRNNLVYNSDGRSVIAVHDDVSGINFTGNLLNEVDKPAVSSGFSSQSIDLEKASNGLLYPSEDKYSEVGASRDLSVLDRSSTGAFWYPKAEPVDRFDAGEVITVPAEEGALSDAVKNAGAGDVISLRSGLHVVARTLLIDRPLTFRSANADEKAQIEFEKTALFEIADGGSLKLSGLHISGAASLDYSGSSVIRTVRRSMLGNYILVVEDSAITDLNVNHSFSFLSVAKHTFADQISIFNSSFENITGHVLQLNAEVEDLGIYNSEYIQIKDSEFSDIEGAVVDIYRGGTDESTFGPHFAMSGSSIDNVGNGSRNKTQASVYLLGVQATTIRDNQFVGSQPIRVVHTVGGPVTRIAENDFKSTADPVIANIGDL